MKFNLKSKKTIITAVVLIAVMIVIVLCSNNDDERTVVVITGTRKSLPFLKSQGVATVVTNSKHIEYKIIAEDWFIYDQADTPVWTFEKGLFAEKYNDNNEIDVYLNCDTAYFYNEKQLWEFRSNVLVKNLRGETFKTSLIYYNTNQEKFYSDRYMEIDGIEQDLSGYNFSGNKSLTEYTIYSSAGAFPVDDDEEDSIDEQADTRSESDMIEL